MYLTIAATFRAKELIFIVFPGPLSNGCFMKMYSLVCVVGGGGEGGWSKTFYTGKLRREVQPLTLLWTIFDTLTEKVPPLYTFYHTQFRTLHPFQLL